MMSLFMMPGVEHIIVAKLRFSPQISKKEAAKGRERAVFLHNMDFLVHFLKKFFLN